MDIIFGTNFDLVDLFKKIKQEISSIDKKDIFNLNKFKKDIRENFKTFLTEWKSNFLFSLKVIENSLQGPTKIRDVIEVSIKRNKYFINYNQYNNKYSQTGGFNSCNLNNKSYVIPTIMKYFNKYTNKVLRNDSLDIFKNLCEDLLNNIKTPGYFKST